MNPRLFTALLVTGADARTFLQGQLTCDMDTLTREHPLLASVNSAQGRVQAVIRVLQRDEGAVLLVLNSIAEKTLQRLKKYVLRAKVKIELTNGDSVRDDEWFTSASLLAHLQAGIPHVFPETYESFVAQMLNLDALDGISFEKGCYTGQEIIARAHFRGAVKRRMFRFAANQPPPVPGTRLLANEVHAGDVAYAVATANGCELLAVVSLAQTEAKLTIESKPDSALTRLDLPYSQKLRDTGHET